MAGKISSKRREIMAAVKAKHTQPELKLRKHLSSLGLRYRLHKRNLAGTPDVVFVREKVAVFCDGDFWHGRKWKRRKADGQFRVRKKYWVDKIEENIRRDRRVNRRLKKDGWLVLRYWATEIGTNGPEIARSVAMAIKKRSLKKSVIPKSWKSGIKGKIRGQRRK